MSTLSLGDVIEYEGVACRVVRIITRSMTLFEPEDGSAPYILDESYIELKGIDGEIRFLMLSGEKQVYNGRQSAIRGLPPIPYKKEM